MLDRRHRRWAGVVQLLYKYFVFSGYIVLLAALRPGVDRTASSDYSESCVWLVCIFHSTHQCFGKCVLFTEQCPIRGN